MGERGASKLRPHAIVCRLRRVVRVPACWRVHGAERRRLRSGAAPQPGGRSGGQLACPVAAILLYLVDRTLRPGPLFVFIDGRPLRKDALVQRMQQALTSAGIDNYSEKLNYCSMTLLSGYLCDTNPELVIRTKGTVLRSSRLVDEFRAPAPKW